ncbi:MAG: histidine phosphatase family protein [Candidatus Omnitrophota bacterium]
MTQLILVRRGQTDWDKQERVQGTLDIPLNNEGKEEAQKISCELSGLKIARIYSSPSCSSLSTASEIALKHELKVKEVPDLSELNCGHWQGLCVKDIKKRYGKQYGLWKASPVSTQPPGGESIKDACDRAISALHKIVDKHSSEKICIVSGDIILSIIKCYLQNEILDNICKTLKKNAWWELIGYEKNR